MIYKVGVLGATGKVGLEICSLLGGGYSLGEDYFELSDAVAENKDLESVEGVPVRTIQEPDREPVHGWIDFSSPAATLNLLKKISGPIVIGTTGFDSSQKQQIENYSKSNPVLWSSNLSPGMNWFFSMLKTFGLPLGVKEIGLTEEHHRYKKDAPSGTAKTLLQILSETSKIKPQVQSIRAGEVVGVHELTFYSNEEEIKIIHRVNDRKVFATGAILGVQFLLRQKKAGLFSMEDLYHGKTI